MLAGLFLLSLASALEATDNPRFVLWDRSKPVPTAAECPRVEGVEFAVVRPHKPAMDGYNWLHGAAVCWHRGYLVASFGHNKGSENTSTEVANGCKSTDGGKTWGPLFAIDDGDPANPAVSHGVLLSCEGRLWAFQGAFYDRMQRVHTLAYLRNEQTGKWEPKGTVAEDGFWPMQEPLKMDDGNLEQMIPALYPGLITNHHLMRIPAMIALFAEWKTYGCQYAKAVVENAIALANELDNIGCPVVRHRSLPQIGPVVHTTECWSVRSPDAPLYRPIGKRARP